MAKETVSTSYQVFTLHLDGEFGYMSNDPDRVRNLARRIGGRAPNRVRAHKGVLEAERFLARLGVDRLSMYKDDSGSQQSIGEVAMRWRGVEGDSNSFVSRMKPMERLAIMERAEAMRAEREDHIIVLPTEPLGDAASPQELRGAGERDELGILPEEQLSWTVPEPVEEDGFHQASIEMDVKKDTWPEFIVSLVEREAGEDYRTEGTPTHTMRVSVAPGHRSYTSPSERGVAGVAAAIESFPVGAKLTAIRAPNQAAYNSIAVHAPRWIRRGTDTSTSSASGNRRARTPRIASLAMQLYGMSLTKGVEILPPKPEF